MSHCNVTAETRKNKFFWQTSADRKWTFERIPRAKSSSIFEGISGILAETFSKPTKKQLRLWSYSRLLVTHEGLLWSERLSFFALDKVKFFSFTSKIPGIASFICLFTTYKIKNTLVVLASMVQTALFGFRSELGQWHWASPWIKKLTNAQLSLKECERSVPMLLVSGVKAPLMGSAAKLTSCKPCPANSPTNLLTN